MRHHSMEKLDNLPRYKLNDFSQESQTTCLGMCSMTTLGRSQTICLDICMMSLPNETPLLEGVGQLA